MWFSRSRRFILSVVLFSVAAKAGKLPVLSWPEWMNKNGGLLCERIIVPQSFPPPFTQLEQPTARQVFVIASMRWRDWTADGGDEEPIKAWPAALRVLMSAQQIYWHRSAEIELSYEKATDAGLKKFRIQIVKMPQPEPKLIFFTEITGSRAVQDQHTPRETRVVLRQFCDHTRAAFKDLTWLLPRRSCRVRLRHDEEASVIDYFVQFPPLHFDRNGLDLIEALAQPFL